MRIAFLVILMIKSLTLSAAAQGDAVIFADDFSNYHNGADGSPTWTISKGFWQVENGVLVQRSLEYDCGAMLDIFLDRSFEFSFDFRVLTGEPGAGFFFHSESYRSTAFSHMSRFESNQTMLVGHFMDAGYECTHSARLREQDFSTWHHLLLRVDQDRQRYDILLDGQPIAENRPLLFPAGYCGLQSSGGSIQFDNVALKRLPMTRPPVALSWLHHFWVTNDQLVVPHPARGIIQRFDLTGQWLSSFGTPASDKGALQQPTAIAQLHQGDFVIGDQGRHRIHRFDKQGNWKAAYGYFGSGDGQLNGPADICVDRWDRIYIADEGNHRIVVLDSSLQAITTFGAKELDHPVAVFVDGDQIFVLNNGTNQVKLFAWHQGKIRWQRDIGFGSGTARDLVVQPPNMYIAVGNEVRLIDLSGKQLQQFRGESIQGIFPYGLALNEQRQLYVSDFRTGRFYLLPPDLSEPHPKVTFPDPQQARISFQTTDPVSASIRISHQDRVIYEAHDSKQLRHQFQIQKLSPSMVYHFQITPTVTILPEAAGFAKNYSFITPAARGTKHFWRLPMATIIFTQVMDSAKTTSSVPLPPLPPAELARIKAQIEDGIRFYWLNSGLHLFLDNTYVIIDEPLYHHQIFGSQWWYPPKEEWVQRALARSGQKIDDVVAVLFLACVREFHDQTQQYELRGKGGGFTAGIGANGQFGLSYWEVTAADHGSGNNWLMVHEFHHQLDELFLVSGYPEYWFNHFSPTINTAAKFGEHFDGNAYILKNWPEMNWYDLKFGSIQFTKDADGDGIPDDDPRLPMDEQRLHSNPLRRDSDGDGISDREELQFANWIIEGCGETYGGETLFPNLMQADSDGDGLSDAVDSAPLIPFTPVIRSSGGAAAEAGLIDEGHALAKLVDRRIQATVYAHWDSTGLWFAIKMDRLAPVKLMIDADADGWFLGRDNYLIYLNPQSASELATELVMVNCADPKQWPFHDKELAKRISLTSQISRSDNDYWLTVGIPRNRETNLKLEAGEMLGINIGFGVITDVAGHQRYVTMFEPNRFFDVRLAE